MPVENVEGRRKEGQNIFRKLAKNWTNNFLPQKKDRATGINYADRAAIKIFSTSE